MLIADSIVICVSSTCDMYKCCKSMYSKHGKFLRQRKSKRVSARDQEMACFSGFLFLLFSSCIDSRIKVARSVFLRYRNFSNYFNIELGDEKWEKMRVINKVRYNWTNENSFNQKKHRLLNQECLAIFI